MKIFIMFSAILAFIANSLFLIGVCYLAIKSNSGIFAVSGIMLSGMNYAMIDNLWKFKSYRG